VNGGQRSYLHRGGEVPLLGATIPEHFAEIARRFADHEAVVCRHQGRRLSYARLAAETDYLARGLLGLGFRPGERIGVWATDNVEWLLLQLATARIGAVLVNVNPAYRPRELAYALERSEVQGLFAIPRFRSSDYAGMLCDLVPELAAGPREVRSTALPHLRRIVLWDPAASAETQVPTPGFTPWGEVLAAAERVSAVELERIAATLDADDPINIQYTSGTTGFPKAVVLSHHNILNNAWFAAHALRFTEADRLCVPVPFYHCFGMVLSNLLCFSIGACLVVPAEHFDSLAVLEAVAEERCTALHGVPTMFIAELENPRFREFDLSSLRTGIMAGAPCPPELMKRVMAEMHLPEILIGYGQTEASPLTHLTAPDDTFERRIETVGRNLPHQETKVAHPATGRALPVDEVGEVCFRGYHVMKGYYGDPVATARAIDDTRWLRSGDLGTMDANGYLRITGRLKDMIIRGGENIYPAEIEAFIFTHPKVTQVAVFGVPDPRFGEEVAAWVQLHAGARMDEEELRAFCRGGMAHYKVPRHIRFISEFPMTVTGKLQKFRMREIMTAELKTAGGTIA
jgi:fatty-acyl-CoA synthase